jgi:hypothetical protein
MTADARSPVTENAGVGNLQPDNRAGRYVHFGVRANSRRTPMGSSAPLKDLQSKLRFTPEAGLAAAKRQIDR